MSPWRELGAEGTLEVRIRTSWERRMNIGRQKRIIEVEPEDIPVPEELPEPEMVPEPEPEPLEPAR